MSDPTPRPSPPAPTPAIDRLGAKVYHGDAVTVLPELGSGIGDALITDPPYGLGFNGNTWDGVTGFRDSLPGLDTDAMSPAEVFEEWCTAWAQSALQVLRPGAHLAAFGGTRTWHRCRVWSSPRRSTRLCGRMASSLLGQRANHRRRLLAHDAQHRCPTT